MERKYLNEEKKNVQLEIRPAVHQIMYLFTKLSFVFNLAESTECLKLLDC